MPHIILEYTTDQIRPDEIEVLIGAVYAVIAESRLFEEGNIKVRAIPVDIYRLAAGKKGFIHLQCRIHTGRTDIQKKSLSSEIVKSLEQLDLSVSVITCEVVEMDRSSYSKSVTQ